MKKKFINRPEFENSPEMLEEISFRINSFMIHQLEKTNNLTEALMVAGCVSASLFKLYETLLGPEEARKVFLEMSKTKLSEDDSPTVH